MARMNDNKTNRYTENYMINFSRAMEIVTDKTPCMTTEKVSLTELKGRVLAEDITSRATIPAFDNSAMDGYAVNSSDLELASKENPVYLELIGLTAAGDSVKNNSSKLETKGKAWKIMTGAPVAEGFDSIIPVENTSLETNSSSGLKQVSCYSSATTGAHIRKAGEDFKEHCKILSAGTIINSNSITVLAAQGAPNASVRQKINITLFSTGKELVDNPEQPLKPGQIRNSNRPFILDWLSQLPVNIHDAGTNDDNVEKFEADLQSELDKNTQIIISSGAVSMGDFDFIPQTITKLGGEIIFHKLKIRPGKPLLFAKFPNGSLYFGLPGNPISSIIGLRFFVSHAIRKLLDLPQENAVSAIVKNSYQKKKGVRCILKASAQINANAQQEISILDGQQSFKINPLLKANGWAIITEDLEKVDAGDLIHFYPSSMLWE